MSRITMITGVLRLAAILLPLTGVPSMAQAEPARWNVDPEFRVARMLVSKTTGQFMIKNIMLAGTFNGAAKDCCLLGHSSTRCSR
jgi:hypothetical protein